MSDGKLPSEIDRIVGQRIRWRRRDLKITQERLAEMLGLTFQQVQKYEKGVNRVSAGRLFEIAGVMGVTVSYFFEGAEGLLEPTEASFAEDEDPTEAFQMTAEMLDLVAAFQKIENAALRKSILDTVRAAASAIEARTSEAEA